jgi:hypothetical protein
MRRAIVGAGRRWIFVPESRSNPGVYSQAMESPLTFQCDECVRIARALRLAWRADNRALRAKMQQVAAASGRNVQQLNVGWVFSIANMPDDEMNAVLESHYPEVTRARRRRHEHEAATGHSVPLHGWSSNAFYRDDEPDQLR